MKLIKEMLKDPKTLIKIKVGVALGGLAAILVILLVVAAALLSPIDAGVQVFENISDATSAIMEKLGNFFTLKGWKLDKEVEIAEEQEFYKKLDQVKDSFRSKYGVEIDTDLIVSTLFYNRTVKSYFEEYSDSIRQDCSTDELFGNCADPSNHMDYKAAMKNIKILASFQVATNAYIQPEGDEGCADEEYAVLNPDSYTARQVASNDGKFQILDWVLFSWEKNTRHYDQYYKWKYDDEGNRYCPHYPPKTTYSLEVDQIWNENESTGVYYWNLVDEPDEDDGANAKPGFVYEWFQTFMETAPPDMTEEERRKELVSNIYDFARSGLGDYYAYRGTLGAGQNNFGDVDFISRNESIEGLDDAFYTTMSNPFYASGINQGYNPYQCTTYVYGRVSEVLAENGMSGKLNVSGHAGNWYSDNLNKGPAGYPSTSDPTLPKAGSIAVFGGGAGGYGHVVFVEKVNSDGTIDISEGNVRGTGNRYGYRYTAGIDPKSTKFQNLYGLNFTGYIYVFD